MGDEEAERMKKEVRQAISEMAEAAKTDRRIARWHRVISAELLGVSIKFDPSTMRLPYESEAFRSAWCDWCEDRKKRKKPLTERAARLQLIEIVRWGESAAIESIETSIKAGWQGLFPPKVVESQRKETNKWFV